MPAVAPESGSTFCSRLATAFRGQLVGNALSLCAVQGLNYLMPLLLLPFLLRALSPQGYGAIMFAQALIGYAVILTEFGFNFTAARDISIARDTPQEVARIYWTTMAAKLFLLSISLLLVALVVALTPRFRHDWPIFAASSLILLGNVAFPQWYFQGLEKLKDVAVVQAVAKCVVTASAIVLVRTPNDIYTAAIILSSPQLMGAVVGRLMGKRLAPTIFYRPKQSEIRLALQQSWYLFTGSISTTLYLNTNTFVLGLMCGEHAVAMYSVGGKVVSTIQGLGTPITQSVFPRASLLFNGQRAAAWSLLRRVALIILPPISVICLLTGIFAPTIVHILAGGEYTSAERVLQILSVVPLLVTVAVLLSQVVMVNIGLTRQLSRIYLLVGLLNLVMLWPLINAFAETGAALALVIAETVGPILMILAIKRWAASEVATSPSEAAHL
jgi:polysaccharide transporter, PST family